MTRFVDVLKDKNFLLLWLAQVISNFGDRLNQMALVALVYQRQPGSAMALAKLIAFTIIPVFIIGPVAGVWVDRFNRKNVMIISDLVRGVLVFTIPFFIFANQILPIYFVVFLTFSISRFFIPSKMAIIPELVTKDNLLVANTLSTTTNMIGNVVGLVVAGVIVNMPHVGAVGGFYIDAASFFVSASLIAFIVQRSFVREVVGDLELTRAALGQSLRKSVIDEIREGVRYLTSYSTMRFVVTVFAVLMAGLGAISCVIIVFIQEAFASATRDLGFLGMFLIGGLFAGTILYGKYCQRLPKRLAVFLSFIASGACIILFTFFVKHYPHLMLAGVSASLLGASISPMMVVTNTLTHETIPQEVRGRIFSSLEVVIHLAFLVCMFMTALLSRYIDRSLILMATGGVFVASGIAGMVRNRARRATSA